MKRPCFVHPQKKAIYPKEDPIFCSMRCAAEDAVDLRSDCTPMECEVYWCDCNQWVSRVNPRCSCPDQGECHGDGGEL